MPTDSSNPEQSTSSIVSVSNPRTSTTRTTRNSVTRKPVVSNQPAVSAVPKRGVPSNKPTSKTKTTNVNSNPTSSSSSSSSSIPVNASPGKIGPTPHNNLRHSMDSKTRTNMMSSHPMRKSVSQPNTPRKSTGNPAPQNAKPSPRIGATAPARPTSLAAAAPAIQNFLPTSQDTSQVSLPALKRLSTKPETKQATTSLSARSALSSSSASALPAIPKARVTSTRGSSATLPRTTAAATNASSATAGPKRRPQPKSAPPTSSSASSTGVNSTKASSIGVIPRKPISHRPTPPSSSIRPCPGGKRPGSSTKSTSSSRSPHRPQYTSPFAVMALISDAESRFFRRTFELDAQTA